MVRILQKDDKQAVAQRNILADTTGIKVNSIPPLNMKKSSKAKFRARVDYHGAALVKFRGIEWYVTNNTYRAGYDQFYIFEIKMVGVVSILEIITDGYGTSD